MVDRIVRLVAPGVGEIRLRDDAENYLRRKGGSGWGMAPVINSFFEGAADGGIYRGTRRTMRTITLPVSIFGSDIDQVEDRIRALTRVCRVPLRLTVEYDNGNVFWIEAIYDSGASGAYGNNHWEHAELPLVFTCPDPYWTSETTQSFEIGSAQLTTGFMAYLSLLQVAPSTALGQVPIENLGDVDSAPTWIIRGPGGPVSFELGDRSFVLDTVLAPGEIRTIRKESTGWLVLDEAGGNRYTELGPAPQFFEFPPGLSTVAVAMPGATAATSISARYPERREVVY